MRAFPLIQLSEIAIDGPTDRPPNRQPDSQTARQKDRQTARQKDRQMNDMDGQDTDGRWNVQTDRSIYIPP